MAQIPRGKVVTYRQVATLLEAPRAAWAVGYSMKQAPPGGPWQRVINTRGSISLRTNVSGRISQRILLEQEGVRFRSDRVDFRRYR